MKNPVFSLQTVSAFAVGMVIAAGATGAIGRPLLATWRLMRRPRWRQMLAS